MRNCRLTVKRPLVIAMPILIMCLAAYAGDWPQYGCTPQRTNYSSENIAPGPYRLKWKVDLLTFSPPQTLHPSVQVVSANGKCFLPSREGFLHAFDSKTGKHLWKFDCASPVVHSAAVKAGKVFVATLGGTVYAVNTSTGNKLWEFNAENRTGFSCAPLLAENNVYVCSRDGVTFAVNSSDGTQLWRRDIKIPIYHSPAYDIVAGTGRIYFGANDMRVYALDAANGSIVWKSPKFYGTGFLLYSPVCTAGKVIVRCNNPFGRIERLEQRNKELAEVFDFFYAYYWMKEPADKFLHKFLPANKDMLNAGRIDPNAWPQFYASQQKILDLYKEHPEYNDMYILDQATGQQVTLSIRNGRAITGETQPPCLDRDGLLTVPTSLYTDNYARLDPQTGLLVDMLFDVDAMINAPPDRNWYRARIIGGGNADENMNLSCVGNQVLLVHHHGTTGAGVHWTGAFDLDKRTWWGPLPGGNPRSNTQHAGNPISASDGVLFHQSFHVLYARQSDMQKEAAQ